jgi:GH18 family chitinase
MPKAVMIRCLIGWCAGLLAAAVAQAQTQNIVYFPEWGVHLQPYYVRHIQDSGAADQLTVINYAFVVPAPNAAGDVVCQMDDPVAAYQQLYTAAMSVDGIPDVDDAGQPLRGHFNQFKKLKAEHPHLKVLIAIGGWLGSVWWSDAATPESRETFVASCIDLFIRGNLPVAGTAGGVGVAAGVFDGFDIDWEYPITGGAGGTHHSADDDVNLTATLAEFRQQLDALPRAAGTDPYLLTMATPGSAFRGDNYQINADQAHVDWFNLMTYDYHGGWENKTGHQTNILTSVNDPSSDAFKLSIDNAVRLYRDTYGVSVEKLVIGAAFYGRGWSGVSTTDDGLYQSGRTAPGIYEDGYNYYRDLAPLMLGDYTLHWDPLALASWLYSPVERTFWTLDEPQSIALKRRYADAFGLGGVMAWEVSGDDEDGTLVSAMRTGDPGAPVQSSSSALDGAVEVTQPASCAISVEGFNQVLGAETTVSAPAKVDQVEFFGNGVSLGFDNFPPWSWAWFNLPAGVHEITAVASDWAGSSTSSTSVLLNVYSEADMALWQVGASYQPGDEVFYDGCIYSAKRNHVGSRVRLPTGARYWDLVTCSDCGGGGGGGGEGGNQPPVIESITASPSTSIRANENVTLTVVAGDPEGWIASVVFAVGAGVESGVYSEFDTWTWTWSNVPAGTHEVTVTAHDNSGATASDRITIVAASGSGCTAPAWDATLTYDKGDRVQHNDILWQAKRTVAEVEPGTSPSKWTNLGPCTS